MTKPLPLPDIKQTVINGEPYICMAGWATMMCNVATGRLEGDPAKATEIIQGLATKYRRSNVDNLLKAAETDDDALMALMIEMKVLLQLDFEAQRDES